MSDEYTQPDSGDRFTDAEGRTLNVEEVNPGDPAGREVVGRLRVGAGPLRDYSCTLRDWARTWRDKTPPVPVREQTGGLG